MIKNMIKVIDEQPDEKTLRVRSGRVLSTGGSVPVKLGVHHLPHVWVCLPTQKLSKPHTSQRMGCGAKSFKLLIMS